MTIGLQFLDTYLLPIKASKSEDVSDLGNSIHLLFNDAATSILLREAISNRLTRKYLSNNWPIIKHSFRKLVGLKPLTITVTFPDGTIDFEIHGGVYSSVEFEAVADTAVDNDGKPINKPIPMASNNIPTSIGHGYYVGSGDYFGGYTRVNCKTTFINTSSGVWTKTLSCNFSY